MMLAGLWETWRSPEGPVESCTICTTEANEFMSTIHDRMPVILEPAVIDHWLDPTVTDAAEIRPALTQYPSDRMKMWPVGKAVGNVRNQRAGLLEPIEIA